MQTLIWSSLAQATALTGFLLTVDEAALFAVSAAFGLGFSGLLPAYVIVIRKFYPVKEANWRVPAVYFAGFLGMAAGGWGAGPFMITSAITCRHLPRASASISSTWSFC